jgi:hypothetical protein
MFNCVQLLKEQSTALRAGTPSGTPVNRFSGLAGSLMIALPLLRKQWVVLWAGMVPHSSTCETLVQRRMYRLCNVRNVLRHLPFHSSNVYDGY